MTDKFKKQMENLKNNIDIKIIMDSTGLSKEEIEKLK